MFRKLPSTFLPAALLLTGGAVMSAPPTRAQTVNTHANQSEASQGASPPSMQANVPANRVNANASPAAASEPGVPAATAPTLPDPADPVLVHRDPPPADLRAPKDFVENKTVAMPLTGERALRASGAWDATVNPAAMGNDGRVIFAYGAGMPVVVCAPLRVCIIELERGEHIVSAPHIGDAVRWDVSLEFTGAADQNTPLVVLKPRDVGLDTSLFIPTDRRSYYIRLLAKSGAYTPMVAFEYPEDDQAKMQKEILHQEQQQKTEVSPITSPVDALFYDYEIKGNGPFRPLRVMDDGAKTYIEMPAENVHRDLPALVIEGPAGDELVNFRVKDNYYIVDRLFDKAALLLSGGKHTEKVEIIRQRKLAHSTGTQNAPHDKPGDGSN